MWWGSNTVFYTCPLKVSAILFSSICHSLFLSSSHPQIVTMWCCSPHANPKTAMVFMHWLWNRLQLVENRFFNLFLSILKPVHPRIALPFKKWCANKCLSCAGAMEPWVECGMVCEGSVLWTNWVTVRRASSTSRSQPNNDKCCILFSKASSFKKAVKQVKIGYLSINNTLSPLVTDTCCWQIGINIWGAKKMWSHCAETSEYIVEERKWVWS